MLLAVALGLSMTACGDKTETTENKTLAQELGYGYVSEYRDLDMEIDYVNAVSSAQGMLYFSGDYYDEDSGINSTKMFQMDPATGDTVEVTVPQLDNQEGVSEYVQKLSVCPDGSGYWVVIERYVYDVDTVVDEAVPMPIDEEELTDSALEGTAVEEIAEEITEEITEDILEDSVMEDDLTENMTVATSSGDGNRSTAKKLDMDGNTLVEIDLTAVIEDMDYFYPQAMAQNSEGDLLIACDAGILVFGEDGTQKPTIEMQDRWIQDMVATGNGTVLASYYDSDAGKLVACRVENGALSQPLEITGYPEVGNMSFYSGDGDTMLLNDGTVLYSLDVNTGVATKLLSWLDSDINGGNLAGIAASGADKIAVMTNHYGSHGVTYELGFLTKTPVEEIPERTLLTLGAIYLDSNLENAVIDFNRNNDTYRITLVDYSEYNTAEDSTLASKQLDRDVISGNCPDIISLSTGHQDKYIEKGVLADLSAMLEKDDSLSMDDFLSGPLQAFSKNGTLYGIPNSFYMESVKVSRKLVGDITSWDMSTLGEIIKDLDIPIMQYTDQAGFVTQTVYQNISTFVDYGKSTCSFDSDAFKQLLETASYFPTEEEMNAESESMEDTILSGMWVDPDTQVQAGEMLMNSEYLGDSYAVKYHYNLYTEENGFLNLGYPQNEGNGAVIFVSGGLAISAKSKYQDGAWEFLKTTLSDENQLDSWQFPVTVSALDEYLAEAMERPYYMEGDEKVYYDDSAYIGDTEYPLEPLTQEQLDDFKDYINGAVVSGNYDTDIMEIIEEEVGAYFAGDKTADEVATLIQNRVTIYLGENS